MRKPFAIFFMYESMRSQVRELENMRASNASLRGRRASHLQVKSQITKSANSNILSQNVNPITVARWQNRAQNLTFTTRCCVFTFKPTSQLAAMQLKRIKAQVGSRKVVSTLFLNWVMHRCVLTAYVPKTEPSNLPIVEAQSDKKLHDASSSALVYCSG